MPSLPCAVAMVLVVACNAALAAQVEDWKTDWDKTVEAAKKEGEVVIYRRGYAYS